MYLCAVWWDDKKKYYHLCDMKHKEIEKLTSIFDELHESKIIKHFFFDRSTGMPPRLSSRILREDWKNSNLLEDIARNYFDLNIHYKYSDDYFTKRNNCFREIYSTTNKNTGSQTNEITALDIVMSHNLIENDNEYINTGDNTEDNTSDDDDNTEDGYDNEDSDNEENNDKDNDDYEYQNNIETDSIDSDDEGDPMGKPIQSTESTEN